MADIETSVKKDNTLLIVVSVIMLIIVIGTIFYFVTLPPETKPVPQPKNNTSVNTSNQSPVDRGEIPPPLPDEFFGQ